MQYILGFDGDAQFDAHCRELFPRAQIGNLRISPAEPDALAAQY